MRPQHSPPLPHRAPDPVGELGDVGVDPRLVLLSAADAPADDAGQVPLPALLVLDDQGAAAVTLPQGKNT